MPLENIRETATRANAMRAGGMDSKRIIDRLLQSKTTPEVNQRIQQFRQQGISDDKIVSDLSKKSEQIQPTVTAERPGGVLGGLGRALGTERLATRIGSELGIAGLDPDVKRRLGEAEEKGFVPRGTQRELRTGGVTGKQALASAGLTGLSLALPFASKFLAPTGAGLGSLVARQAGAGGLAGGLAAVSEGEEFGRGALAGGLIGGAIPLAGATLSYFSRRIPKLLGMISGESVDIVEQGLRNPQAVDIGLEQGNVAIRNTIKQGSKGAIKLRGNFNKSFNSAMKTVFDSADETIPKKTILSQFDDLLKGAKVKIKRGKLDFDISNIKANPGEVTKINNAYKSVKNWDDFSVAGVNKLKQNIGKFTRYTTEGGLTTARSDTLNRLYGQVDDLIVTSLPESSKNMYIANNRIYSKNIGLLDDLVDVFTKGKSKFSRITGLFGKNKDELREIIEMAEGVGVTKDLPGIVAGRELGLEKGGIGSLDIRSAFDVLFSPKAQGKLITTIGKAQQFGARQLGREFPIGLGGVSGELGKARRQLTTGIISQTQ